MLAADAYAPARPPDRVALLLRDLVHETTGIYFDVARLELMLDKLEPLASARGQSFIEFYYLLKYGQEGAAEWSRVADVLSVQETYFWREMSQIQTLVNHLVPQWFAQHHRPLRIWSAACASGEEPYTLAIALEEAGWGRHPIEIVATDASPSALQKARAGIYRERSFRALPPELRQKYFSRSGEGGSIDSAIKARVSFHRANLVAQPEISEWARSPAVFCRNVFIYFSPEAIRRTLEVLARFMPVGAWLFVGISESLIKLTEDFELQELGGAFLYVRKSHLKL